MRNASVLSIAPTGTIARIAGCSSSIEPIFSFNSVSKIIDSDIEDYHLLYKKWEDENSGEPHPDYFITAGDIEPEEHIKMQGVFQDFVDSAVSKTINFPNEASEKEIAKAFKMAFDMNIKGITVYRDGCRKFQVLYNADKKSPQPMDRPELLPSKTYKISTGFGILYVTVSLLEERPFEIFCSIGKSGYSTMADAEAIGRLASLALRSGIEVNEIISQLKGIGSSEPIFHNGKLVRSIPDAVALVLEKVSGKEEAVERDMNSIRCPECQEPLPDERCPICTCGWSRCQ